MIESLPRSHALVSDELSKIEKWQFVVFTPFFAQSTPRSYACCSFMLNPTHILRPTPCGNEHSNHYERKDYNDKDGD
ncbi:hypothetical protein LCGC14_1979290 [marine sediment metagenome]|uniref:Uncharacterized protein n=1 Tax=marine sediment metagenome TaxID=412755 RepID=A0A0F9F9F0_9ZZZZ